MTPNELAAKLAGPENAERIGKTFVRPYLRKFHARVPEAKGTSWTLDAEIIKEVQAAWKARNAAKA